jgi:hypothetical protein
VVVWTGVTLWGGGVGAGSVVGEVVGASGDVGGGRVVRDGGGSCSG